MTEQRAALRIVLTLSLAAVACGHPEQKVVDQYFTALNANDNQTLSSFAIVAEPKGKPVERWTINQTGEEQKVPAPLVELVKKYKEAETKVTDNKKEAQRYNNEHYTEIDQVKELTKKGARIPPNLKPHADKWDEFNKNDREYKKILSTTKEAMEREKRIVALSIGTNEGLDALNGDMLTKTLDVTLNVGGEPKNYQMVLRRYDMSGAQQRLVSRWVIFEIKPKA